MTDQSLDPILAHPDFVLLVRRKQQLYWSLTAVVLLVYYGFVLLVAYAPGALGRSLSGGVTSVGMLVGVLIMLLVIGLTGFYVYRANHLIDPLIDTLKQEFEP